MNFDSNTVQNAQVTSNQSELNPSRIVSISGDDQADEPISSKAELPSNANMHMDCPSCSDSDDDFEGLDSGNCSHRKRQSELPTAATPAKPSAPDLSVESGDQAEASVTAPANDVTPGQNETFKRRKISSGLRSHVMSDPPAPTFAALPAAVAPTPTEKCLPGGQLPKTVPASTYAAPTVDLNDRKEIRAKSTNPPSFNPAVSSRIGTVNQSTPLANRGTTPNSSSGHMPGTASQPADVNMTGAPPARTLRNTNAVSISTDGDVEILSDVALTSPKLVNIRLPPTTDNNAWDRFIFFSFRPQRFSFKSNIYLSAMSPFSAVTSGMEGVDVDKVCAVCGAGTCLRSCSRCPLAFHRTCVDPSDTSQQVKNGWMCLACRSATVSIHTRVGPVLTPAPSLPSPATGITRLIADAREGNPIDFVMNPSLFMFYKLDAGADWLRCCHCGTIRVVEPGVLSESVHTPFDCSLAFWMPVEVQNCPESSDRMHVEGTEGALVRKYISMRSRNRSALFYHHMGEEDREDYGFDPVCDDEDTALILKKADEPEVVNRPIATAGDLFPILKSTEQPSGDANSTSADAIAPISNLPTAVTEMDKNAHGEVKDLASFSQKESADLNTTNARSASLVHEKGFLRKMDLEARESMDGIDVNFNFDARGPPGIKDRAEERGISNRSDDIHTSKNRSRVSGTAMELGSILDSGTEPVTENRQNVQSVEKQSSKGGKDTRPAQEEVVNTVRKKVPFCGSGEDFARDLDAGGGKASTVSAREGVSRSERGDIGGPDTSGVSGGDDESTQVKLLQLIGSLELDENVEDLLTDMALSNNPKLFALYNAYGKSDKFRRHALRLAARNGAVSNVGVGSLAAQHSATTGSAPAAGSVPVPASSLSNGSRFGVRPNASPDVNDNSEFQIGKTAAYHKALSSGEKNARESIDKQQQQYQQHVQQKMQQSAVLYPRQQQQMEQQRAQYSQHSQRQQQMQRQTLDALPPHQVQLEMPAFVQRQNQKRQRSRSTDNTE